MITLTLTERVNVASPWHRRLRRAPIAGLLALLVSLSGCMHPGPQDPARVGPFFQPTNYSAAPSLGGIRRVVLMPVWGGNLAPAETFAALNPIFATALHEENRFEIVTLSREECLQRFGVEAISSASALPHDFLAVLRRDYGADAVMFVDVTAHRAYRPLTLGLRAKLATLASTRLVWTFDNVFTTDDPTTANAARNYFIENDRRGVPSDFTPTALLSPSRFATYAAAAMFATLPPVTLAASQQSNNVPQPVR